MEKVLGNKTLRKIQILEQLYAPLFYNMPTDYIRGSLIKQQLYASVSHTSM